MKFNIIKAGKLTDPEVAESNGLPGRVGAYIGRNWCFLLPLVRYRNYRSFIQFELLILVWILSISVEK